MDLYTFKKIVDAVSKTDTEIKKDFGNSAASLGENKRSFPPLEREIPTFKSDSATSLGENKRSFPPLERDIPTFKDVGESSIEKGELSLGEVRESDDNLSEIENADSLTSTEVGESEGIERRIPRNDGHWTGEPGNSTWIPDSDVTPKVWNPNNETWGEIKDKHDFDGIEFNDGEPDFSNVAEDSVEIEDFSSERDENYDSADEKLAEKWTQEQKNEKTWTSEDIAEYRKDNNLSWHECSDTKTMELVPRDIHLNIPHSGGISMAKQTNKQGVV